MSQDCPNVSPEDTPVFTEGYDIHKLISERLVSGLSKKLGYTFDEGRIVRIAAESRAIMAKGFNGAFATAAAFEIDLLLYGNPHAPVHEIKGIVNVVEEIYSKPEVRTDKASDKGKPWWAKGGGIR